VIVVLGSIITALFMHPDDHAGDREAVLFIAFLITVTNIQTTDTGLGKVTKLLWLDLFNLSQLVLSVIAIFQTVFVHAMSKRQYQEAAMHFDLVSQLTLPLLYVGVTAGMFMLANAQLQPRLFTGGVALIAVACVFLIPGTFILAWMRATSFERHRRRCVQFLLRLDVEQSAETQKAIRDVFASFDVDKSGELDMEEVRDLLSFLKPNASAKDLRSSVKFMRGYADASSGALTVRDFSDALAELQGIRQPPSAELQAVGAEQYAEEDGGRCCAVSSAARRAAGFKSRKPLKISFGPRGKASSKT